jgi:hypothetical protein
MAKHFLMLDMQNSGNNKKGHLCNTQMAFFLLFVKVYL